MPGKVEFQDAEISLARSMTRLAGELTQESGPSPQVFMGYWVAFTNIYRVLARRAGLVPRFGLRKNGTLRTLKVGNMKMAEVYNSPEQSQLRKVFTYFDSGLKDSLIRHPSTRFFVYRVPTFNGKRIKKDVFGQHLNGVINAACTVDIRYPVWGLIDVDLYKLYMELNQGDGPPEKAWEDALAWQILELLSTVRHNLLDGGAIAGAENSQDVLSNAVPLLAMIVNYFV